MSTWNGKGFTYEQDKTEHIAFPIGGIGAGMFCVEGSGMLSNFSLRHAPNLQKEPGVYAAVTVLGKENASRLIEGPVTNQKVFGGMSRNPEGFGTGCPHTNYGLPRFSRNTFSASFPFCEVDMADDTLPLSAKLTAWSPFTPKDTDNSSLPVGSLEYTLTNTSDASVDGVFYFCAPNFISPESDNRTPDEAKGAMVKPLSVAKENGFTLYQPAGGRDRFYDTGWFNITADEKAYIDCDWFRGGWFDNQTMNWNNILKGVVADKGSAADMQSPGASLAIPFSLAAGASKMVRLFVSWYVPYSNLRCGDWHEQLNEWEKADFRSYYRPWYAERFASIDEVESYWRTNFCDLRAKSQAFTDKLFGADVPEVIKDAVSANLCILKSPTVLRQYDGRFWGWEGCQDFIGSCHGSCTHVWNYAQALCKLFPDMERSLRDTEFMVSQNEEGHQTFRTSLPIRPVTHDFHAASDGQLGGIIKLYRDWKISGDDKWLAKLWPYVKKSLAYCIKTWDVDEKGILLEPHHNTYDIEFWGADVMCTSFYLGALKAAAGMAAHFGEPDNEKRWLAIYKAGKTYCETKLWNGEYFIQEVQWDGLRASLNLDGETPSTKALLNLEGPKYQYGTGCISDGVLGAWLAKLAGLGDILDPAKLSSHLLSVYKYNLRHTMEGHSNPQRPGYAVGKEGGLLLCSWPNGNKPSLPFVYSDEVWTGIEHQVASHLMLMGHVEEGLEIERVCRARYDGGMRNPFSEIECGHWYARAMASYALLESLGKDIEL